MTPPNKGGDMSEAIAALAGATAKLIRTERRHERYDALTGLCAAILAGQAFYEHRWFTLTVLTIVAFWIWIAGTLDDRKARRVKAGAR